MGVSIIINTTTIKKSSVLTASPTNNRYIVSATSDQVTKTISDSSLPTSRIEDTGIISFKIRLSIFVTILATISFIIGVSYKRIENYKSQINRSQFVFDIIKQMKVIRETLKNNIQITDIFPLSIWDSIEDKEKRQIFTDPRDYNLISKFYTKLRQRDVEIFQRRNK
jgi:hypothetical protein